MDFTYEQLQDIDDVTKDEYMKRILNEDAQVSTYIKNILEKIEDVEDKIVETEYKIDDTKENWDQNM